MPPRTIQDQFENPPFTQPMPSSADDLDVDNENQDPARPAVPLPSWHHRPSAAWLRNPAWIDGGVNPPKYYYSHEEIESDLRAAGVSPSKRFDQCGNEVSPTPTHPVPPAPLSLDLVNSTRLRLPNPLDCNLVFAPPSSLHVVNVTLIYTPTSAPTTGRGKSTPKKAKITKMDNILLTSISRVDFIKAFLATHGLDKIYSPGVHAGPDFKLWWSGIPGGKTGAPSIQNNHQFDIALQALFKKNKTTIIVNVEFDTDTMEGFCIKQVVPLSIEQGPGNGGNDDELLYGTRVPQVDNFSDLSQLHGRFILELKKRWPCQMHQGEHGEAGHCYVAPSGEHTRLNALRMKTWAAAIAAGDATKHEPPHSNAFDGARDGRISGPKARGRSGPSSRNTASDDRDHNETVTALLTAFLPLIGNLSRKCGHDDKESPVSTPKRNKTSIIATSPTCLVWASADAWHKRVLSVSHCIDHL